jgi:hypothetical protein
MKPLSKSQYLEQFLEGELDTNGYSYIDEDAFDHSPYDVCYIPENAEDEEDVYTRKDLEAEVRTFIRDNGDFVDHDKDPEESMEEYKTGLLLHMWSCLDWQFPCSVLEDYLQARMI